MDSATYAALEALRGAFSWLIPYGIIDFAEVVEVEGIDGAITYYFNILFEHVSNFFFKFLGESKNVFSSIGSSAVSAFHVELNGNFFFYVVGIIFGFFLVKFVLGKVLDLITNLIDPM